MSSAFDGRSSLSRATAPILAAAVLIGLILMLPRRDVQPALNADPLDIPPLELDEPPAWALQRGKDELLRNLDRMEWGGQASLTASRRALRGYRGQLAPELLSRLRRIGEAQPVLAARLVELLGSEDLAAPAVIDELVRRALSRSALEAKAALRVLADVPDRRALDGILPRLLDGDIEVRSFARGALARRASTGDAEAQAVVLAELEALPGEPDLAYLTVLEDFPDPAALRELLHTIAARGSPSARMVALSTLLKQDDPLAIDAFEQLVASNDAASRLDAWRGLAAAQKLGGRSRWKELISVAATPELLALADVLTIAVDTDRPEKGEALDLLLALAADRTNSVHGAVLGALYLRHHPWAVETTRRELRTVVGAELLETGERILSGPADLQAEFAEVALARLDEPGLRDDERALLCRLLAHVAPEIGADAVVRFALDSATRLPELALVGMGLLPQLGPAGFERLSRELETPLGKALFIRTAVDSGEPAALPGLQRILLDPATDGLQRRAALDALARLTGGPREEVLRQAVDAFADAELRQHARLLFWNYL